ncbi:MAG: ATP-binding protein [Treponema sp.]|nr:ATP-binding protein [Treponema sp.]
MKSKSLTFRIFLSTFLVGTLVYFLCAVFFISNIYSYFERKIFNELETEAVFLEHYIENSDVSELKKFDSIKNRITLIGKDGTVYFDNMVDASKMENHGLREEFIAAKEKGSAKVSRYSSTMTDKTLYFAKLLSNGNVLRISCDQHSVAVLVLGMSQTLLIMLVLAIIISGIAAVWTSKKITNPLNQINLENPEDCLVYEELKPFTKRIAEENFEKTQREELRKQFTANVSHELKTPLTSISGFAEILKNGGTDEKTTKDFASTIYEESQRMISLVNDIIKLSKLDEKSISMEKEPIELLGLSKEIAKILSASAKTKNVTLKVHGDTGKIFGVQPVIYEMIYNLIDNAIKYNKQNGTVEVIIKDENKNSSENEPFAGKTTISVRDTGIGIPKNEQERVFERFYRVDKSRSKELGGTGLGLSIVKHAAKYHNATINLSSKEGEGSTFTVTFCS